ncbi:unnamed protein product [Fraxinus pennsylvanica]|uniref:Nudix hydrolase domain-containing protein n=1 Tax=Fraxinus pennsylvanica TaxID=56036 RepID=A0AAD1ZSM2_9LAMI|nr:unnamed protein product [Fraxinus pennsylvanica]
MLKDERKINDTLSRAFLFKFTGKDEEINLLGDGTEKPEFGEWSWLSPEEIINLAVDFKKPVYQEVMTAFSSRSLKFHSSFSLSLLRRTSANTNILFFPYCPPKAHKFTPPSLLHHKVPEVAFSSLSSPSSMENPPQGYRKNVGICLMNPSKKIFAASRLDIPDSWQMPQGGIDENEDPRSAAIRELREETGVSSAYIIAEVPHWLTYDFPPDVREKLRHQWGSDWKGQAQKWFK